MFSFLLNLDWWSTGFSGSWEAVWSTAWSIWWWGNWWWTWLGAGTRTFTIKLIFFLIFRFRPFLCKRSLPIYTLLHNNRPIREKIVNSRDIVRTQNLTCKKRIPKIKTKKTYMIVSCHWLVPLSSDTQLMFRFYRMSFWVKIVLYIWVALKEDYLYIFINVYC